MNIYTLAEKKASEIAALIAIALGLCQGICSSWILHRIVQIESLAVFSYGVRIGALNFDQPLKSHSEAYEYLRSEIYEYLTNFKVSASLGIFSSLLLIASSLILLHKKTDMAVKIHQEKIWICLMMGSFLITSASLVSPLFIQKNLLSNLEAKILVIVSFMILFILLHLIGVVLLQIRKSSNPSEDASILNNSKDPTSDSAKSSQTSQVFKHV